MKTASTLPPGHERLERALAHAGLASRREAKALILSGKVTVNGAVIKETGFGITKKDKIEIKGGTTGKEAVLLYKPRAVETSKTTPSQKDIHDFFPRLKHLAPVGRLDKDSEGLIILTNDGTLTKALTKELSPIDKEYLVTVRENVTDAALEKMYRGILIDKVKTKPAPTKRVSRHSFTVILHEGRKHQIRRMCAACHLTVESLVRIRIGHLKSDGMKPGSTKKLSPHDIEQLKK